MFSDFGDCYRIYRACELVFDPQTLSESSVTNMMFAPMGCSGLAVLDKVCRIASQRRHKNIGCEKKLLCI